MSDFAATVTSGRPVLTDGGLETRVMFETPLHMAPDGQVAALLAHPAPVAAGLFGGDLPLFAQHDRDALAGQEIGGSDADDAPADVLNELDELMVFAGEMELGYVGDEGILNRLL